ncbi:cupin domain-containing protein [Nodularia sp. NIES-3585]|uniref:cupin domain-containing protein n=1 Tax=Nodularia sp. NIES-3585 TaxID=1973477 RepID=UPI000B5C5064|nr:cupin domain-containing protein [Nodularia sp. NIES-3585]GAX36552.1 cupin 2 conserved barrel domain protein [Nodularia sp. NIES-3585]
MTQAKAPAKTAQNFAAADLGTFSELTQFAFQIPGSDRQIEGKIFLKQLLNLTSAEISINNLPPGKSVPFYHKHKFNEEIYIFVQGQGEFQVDERVFAVSEGSVVRVDPQGERCWRNTSNTENLICIVIQAKAGSYTEHTIQDGVCVQKRVSWVGKERV